MAIEYQAVAYLNHGMWVAMCPRPSCNNAEKRGKCDDGTTGGLDSERFICRVSHGGCGLACGVVWPPEIAQIERLVMVRPIVTTRNWVPGETLHDLLHENAMHGFVPSDSLDGGPTRIILGIQGNEISHGTLGFDLLPEVER